MKHLTRCAVLILAITLGACSTTNTPLFDAYAHNAATMSGPGNPNVAPPFTDALAVNYAYSMEAVFMAKSTGARITREASGTAQVGLASFITASETLGYSLSTVTGLGMASVGIAELQKIFDAKNRAAAYEEAASRINDAVKEYGDFNLKPSATVLTPNGWTLANVVQSNILMVAKVLNGHLPGVRQMETATEPMSVAGTKPLKAGQIPVNSRSASARPSVERLERVVITKEVLQDKGLQSKDVPPIRNAAAAILKKSSEAQAAKAASRLGLTVLPDQDPHEAISKVLGGSDLTASRALEILKELQTQVPQ